ncbi:MAG TPA: flagellar basal body P-ring formation chaperone FlgA [Burkholderiaceae bacterium]|nr:flagellar basal body P-ring formation chaperone FlgA [Burkholderiaceae bacterium]
MLALCALAPAAAQVQPASVEDWQAQIRQLATQASAGMPAGTRVEVDVGSLDPRLKLAPCTRITPYLPAGTRLWGRAQVGLRCTEGARWSVFLPVTVKVYAKAWTVNQSLALGTVVASEHLQLDEVDIAAESSPVIPQPQAAIGRPLARALKPGHALREADLKARQWFAAGDTVRVVSVGSNFSVSAEGQALGPGIDGQSAKVRIEGGRVVTGRAVAARQVEVRL